MSNDSVITNRSGHLSSCTGPHAVNAFRLRTLIVALRFRQKTGMDIDRRVKVLSYAKRETGLRTNNIDTLIAAVEVKLADAVAQCDVVTDGVADEVPHV